MSNNNDMKTEVIIPGNEKKFLIFLIVYKGFLINCIIICHIHRYNIMTAIVIRMKVMIVHVKKYLYKRTSLY